LLSEFKLQSAAALFRSRRGLCAATLAVAAACFFASPAEAQVMDIASDGTVSVRQGAGAATWEVVTSPASDKMVDQNGQLVLPAWAYTNTTPPPVPPQYEAMLKQAATSANISPVLLSALVWQESRWNPQALSPKGAMGLAQLMPATARDLGVNPADPVQNLTGGARYLRSLLDQFNGDLERALAAYNAGPGRVRSAGGVPAIAETRNYVASIVRHISYSTSTGASQ
jgi:soluble lytic murein transglycosylase-like protein